jgi:[ribosomal protein S5]-alanine N-acetyltransferase
LNLQTERLQIRNFTMEDFEIYHRIWNEGFGQTDDQGHQDWMEWTVRNYAALASLHQPPYGDRAVVLKSTGELIGGIGLVPAFGPFDTLPYFRERSTQLPTGLSTPEIGLFWVTDVAHRGKGYAVEAAQAVIDFAFRQMWLKRIVATTDYENKNSQAVMRKLGMAIEHNPYKEPFWFQIIGILENPNHPDLTTYHTQEETYRV